MTANAREVMIEMLRDAGLAPIVPAGAYYPMTDVSALQLMPTRGLLAGPLGQPGHRLAQRRRFQRPGQERHLAGDVAPGLGGGHHATPPAPSAES
jgi:hypothetical protein